MEIVKQLNLNKSPQNVPNGSLVFAKNIKLSIDGSYITQEDGLKNALRDVDIDELGNAGDIKGIISCLDRLIIFTSHSKVFSATEGESRYGLVLRELNTNWKWSGGLVTGTYTYNVNKELIASIGEYDADVDVPLKTANLSKGYVYFYNVSDNIPIANLALMSYARGVQIPIGVYHFFIRYELDYQTYSNWFPIGIPYYALNVRQKTLYSDTYDFDDENNAANKRSLNLSRYVNDVTLDSDYSFNLQLVLNNVVGTVKCQIGYLLQKEDGIVGRLSSSYTIIGNDDKQGSINFVFQSNSKEEIDVNDFLENAFSLYNVKNICNYENRLYIANYKETNYNVDLAVGYADNIVTNIKRTTVSEVTKVVASNPVSKARTGYNIRIGSEYIFEETTDNVVNYKFKFSEHPRAKELLNELMDWYDKGASDNDVTTMAHYCYPVGTTVTSRNSYSINDIYMIYNNDNRYTESLESNVLFCVDDANGNRILVAKLFKDYFYFQCFYDNTQSPITKFKGRVPANQLNISSYTIEDNGALDAQGAAYDNAVRTLMPGETYKFFVHYVRADGSYTNGLSVGNTHTVSDTADYKYIYRVEFSNIKIPDGYIGCFFSYEKEEPTVMFTALYTGKAYKGNADGESDCHLFRNSAVETASIGYNSIAVKRLYTTDGYGNYGTEYNDTWHDIKDIKIIPSNGIGYVNGIHVSLVGRAGGIVAYIPDLLDIAENTVCLFKVTNSTNTRFKKTTKDLVRLTGILYGTPDGTYVCNEDKTYSDFNYPAYFCDDSILHLKYGIYIKETGEVHRMTSTGIILTDTVISYSDWAKVYTYKGYQLINTNAISIRKEPEYVGGSFKTTVLKRGDGDSLESEEVVREVSSIVVKPINITDLIELKSEFKVNEIKSFTNYDPYLEVTNNKTGTIRRSEVIRDQSTENTWRIFRANQYKEIDKNKGNITNLVGVGNIFLIHTEHSLFMLDKSSLLKAENRNVQLETPDTFECTPQEVITNNYGGLQIRDAYCVNHHGYWWFDTDYKKIFNFDNGKINDITPDVERLLKDIGTIHNSAFVTDYTNNRIIIAMNGSYFATLSFNLFAGKFISLHDYYFMYGYNTKTGCYIQNNNRNKLFDFRKDNVDIGYYDSLRIVDNVHYPVSYKIRSSDWKHTCAAYVDVIFNANYEIVKSLESIHWIINQITDYTNTYDDRMAEENLDNETNADVNHYSGERIQIYTDSTNTGLLNIYDAGQVNKFNNYKYPYYELGHWNLNYFRNRIATELTDTELSELATKFNTTVAKLKEGLVTITDNRGNKVYRYSDFRSLIYGKYIVVRFIFNIDSRTDDDDSVKPIKFENVWIDVNKY